MSWHKVQPGVADVGKAGTLDRKHLTSPAERCLNFCLKPGQLRISSPCTGHQLLRLLRRFHAVLVRRMEAK
eukprot:scaffold156474_cov42-Prasinocladus_malaysianus.AAC.1